MIELLSCDRKVTGSSLWSGFSQKCKVRFTYITPLICAPGLNHPLSSTFLSTIHIPCCGFLKLGSENGKTTWSFLKLDQTFFQISFVKLFTKCLCKCFKNFWSSNGTLSLAPFLVVVLCVLQKSSLYFDTLTFLRIFELWVVG